MGYVAAVARRVLDETGLLPHINAGTLSRRELQTLRPVAASIGVMLESGALRLTERGGPHWLSGQKAVPSLVDPGASGRTACAHDDRLIGWDREDVKSESKTFRGSRDFTAAMVTFRKSSFRISAPSPEL